MGGQRLLSWSEAVWLLSGYHLMSVVSALTVIDTVGMPYKHSAGPLRSAKSGRRCGQPMSRRRGRSRRPLGLASACEADLPYESQ
jgi:hypothetical protein